MIEFDDFKIEGDDESDPLPPPKKSVPVMKYILIATVVVLVAVGGYFGFGYIANKSTSQAEQPSEQKPPRVLQLDILNGCGAHGVGSKFTDFLRSHGFDVVENKNYKSFQVAQTLVVDRIGDLTAARRVADALGVKEKNVVQQINPDYYVDVSVIIGKDYSELQPLH
jgi:hypothetical protein